MTIRPFALLLSLLVMGCAAGCSTAEPPALPYYDSAELTPRWSGPTRHRIGSFDLVTQIGVPVSEATLRGKVHIASFIYTRCSGVCPLMVQQLQRVQQAFAGAPEVVLVSYSVTPDLDTPATLARFGHERGIDPNRWLLVTGSKEQIYTLARTSYFAADARLDSGAESTAEQFLHTEKVLLVDTEGRLRGVYNGTVPFDVQRLIADVETLLSARS